MKTYHHGLNIYQIYDILSKEECDAIIDKTEQLGYQSAKINNGGIWIESKMRNNESTMFFDKELAASLFDKIKHLLPAKKGDMILDSIDDRFRAYRYNVGEKFDWHMDGATKKENGDRSYFTFIIYLNDGYVGGETGFDFKSIKGTVGGALLFAHKILHCGCLVSEGVKYALRTDVMYTKEV